MSGLTSAAGFGLLIQERKQFIIQQQCQDIIRNEKANFTLWLVVSSL